MPDSSQLCIIVITVKDKQHFYNLRRKKISYY